MRPLIHKKAIRGATPRAGVAAARQRAGQTPVRTAKSVGVLKSKLVANRDLKTKRPGLLQDNFKRRALFQDRVARFTKPPRAISNDVPRTATHENNQGDQKPQTKLAPLPTPKAKSPPVIRKSRPAANVSGAGKESLGSAKFGRPGATHAHLAPAIPNGPSQQATRGASRQNQHAPAAPATKSKAPQKSVGTARPSIFSTLGTGIAHAAQATGKGLSHLVQVPAKQFPKSKQGEGTNIRNAFDNVAEKGKKSSQDPNLLVPVGTKNKQGASPTGKGGALSSDGTGKATRSRDAARGKSSDGAPTKRDDGLLRGPAPASPPPDLEDKSKRRAAPIKAAQDQAQQKIRWQRQRRARTRITNRRHDMQIFRRQRLGGFIDEMFGRNDDPPSTKKGKNSKDAVPKDSGKPAPKLKVPNWKLEDFFNPIQRPSRTESPILLVKSGVSESSSARTSVTEASKHLKDRAREEARVVSAKAASSSEKPAARGFLGRFVNGVQTSVRDSMIGLSESFHDLPMVQNFASATDQAPSRLESSSPLEELSDRGNKEDSQQRLLPPIPCKRLCCHR